MSDHIIKAARRIWGESAILPLADLERFYAIAFAAGMERAAEIVETTKEWRGGKWVSTLCPMTTEAIATAIRAHAQNTKDQS